MTMTENYKILGKYIKDMSSETRDAETYIFVKDYISNYQLNIDINSKALKDKMIEINTIMKFEDKQNNKKNTNFRPTPNRLYSTSFVETNALGASRRPGRPF